MHAELVIKGERVGRKRIERLMVAEGLRGLAPKKRSPSGMPSTVEPPAGNVLARSFHAERPNEVWTTDITQIQTWQGWLYIAVVLDLFSRRVVGWAVADERPAALVVRALDMALARRAPPRGLLIHSDRGSQYTSAEYLAQLAKHGIDCSFSRKGDCHDNAVTEAFFASLKKESLHRRTWATRTQAADEVASYIEAFYNPVRLHSALGYSSPIDFERRMAEHQTLAA